MSKQIKQLVAETYKARFGSAEGGVLVDVRGVSSNQTNDLRASLAKKGIRLTMVRNNLAKGILDAGKMKGISQALSGASVLVYPTDSGVNTIQVARELVDWAKKLDTMQFKGAFFDGTFYDAKATVDVLSKLPTREEAQKNAITIVLSPGRKVAGLVDAIAKKLEAGETITKIA